MANRSKVIIHEILTPQDAVLLLFNEHDAEIARNWQYPTKGKALVDRPLPMMP